MSKTVKTATPSPDAAVPGETELPFEEALSRLESIVDGMESSELPLEQLLTKFEEGARLARVCQTRLAAAEVRVQQLERNLAGEGQTRPVKLGDPAAA